MDRWADAVERRDAEACASLCADDAVVLSSDAPTAIGRGAIQALVQGWVDAGESNDRSGTLAAFLGSDRATLARTYEVDFVVDGVSTSERGRYLVSFRRAGDDWLIEALAIFADPA